MPDTAARAAASEGEPGLQARVQRLYKRIAGQLAVKVMQLSPRVIMPDKPEMNKGCIILGKP
jgi:hypothetical protein